MRFLLPAVVLLLCLLPTARAQETAPTSPTVTVDFGRRVPGVHSMVGFLHGCNETQPADDLITALHPALWRVGYIWLNNRDRLGRLHIPTVLVLSDSWGPQPPTDTTAFDRYARTMAGYAAGRGFAWDIWNEPDIPQFWKGTQAQFFDTFAEAVRVLRAQPGPAAVISGPSLSHYDHAYIAQFLDFCKANHVRLDVLSWHELAVDADIPSVADHLRAARRSFLNNPAYKSLGMKKIEINEIVGPSAQYEPGEILAYFAYLEQGGADGACKGCWPDSHGHDNCSNNTLDGILTPDTRQPRAAWWAYKAYADSVAGRVASEWQGPGIVAFASQGGGQAQIVLGDFADKTLSPATTDVHLLLKNLTRLPGVKKSGRVRLTIDRIPNDGESPLTSPERVGEETVPVRDGMAELTLPGVRLHEAYRLTLR